MRKEQSYYERLPKGIYTRQRANARRREIPFDLSFEDWWKLWEDSGQWDNRGVGRNKSCMSRINDEGGYSLGNVEIKTQWENRQEYLQRRYNKTDPFRPHERTNAWDYGRGT